MIGLHGNTISQSTTRLHRERVSQNTFCCHLPAALAAAAGYPTNPREKRPAVISSEGRPVRGAITSVRNQVDRMAKRKTG